MSAKQRRVKAQGYSEQRIEALGQSPYLDLECKDGTVVRLPHFVRLDDESLGRFEALQRGDGLDREPVLDEDGKPRINPETGKPLTRLVEPPQIDGKPAEPFAVRVMKAILGDDDYRKLRANGLAAGELYELWQELMDGGSGDDLPKDKPS